MNSSDPFNLQRFVDAQDPIYEQVLRELKAGSKRSHWMWFVFPQIQGLGASSMSRKYAISSQEEAAAYLAHPVLGPRLRGCVRLVNALEGRNAEQIFGPMDAIKLRSSLTLFAKASADDDDFVQALKKYFNGEQDTQTLARL